jgi:hypothetical protein
LCKSKTTTFGVELVSKGAISHFLCLTPLEAFGTSKKGVLLLHSQ